MNTLTSKKQTQRSCAIFEDKMPIQGPCWANLHDLEGQSQFGCRPIDEVLIIKSEQNETKAIIQLGKPAVFRAQSAICFGDWLIIRMLHSGVT